MLYQQVSERAVIDVSTSDDARRRKRLLVDIDAPVCAQRGVVQLAIGRVAGTRIVPGLRALLGAILERLEYCDAERRLQLLEHGAECGGHNARADQHDIGWAGVLGLHHKGTPSWSAWRRTGRVGDELRLDAWAKDNVGPTPGVLVDKLPAVPGSRSVLGKEDVARMQHEMLARARLEVERAA